MKTQKKLIGTVALLFSLILGPTMASAALPTCSALATDPAYGIAVTL